MPLYSYRGEKTNQVYTRFYSIGENPGSIPIYEDGALVELAHRDIAADHVATPPTKGWPYASEAAGVQSWQVPEQMEHDRKHGVPTTYTPDGRPVFENRDHRARYLKANGLYDRNGGYSD